MLEKFFRNGFVDFDASPIYSTNAGNLRLELADYFENHSDHCSRNESNRSAELEIER